MDFKSYQQAAVQTTQLQLDQPKDAIAATFGLAHSAGSIANVYKRSLRDLIPAETFKESLKIELGDLLWYATAVATAFKLDLDDVAQANLRRTYDRYTIPKDGSYQDIPKFDAEYPEIERFPRRLVFRFTEEVVASAPAVASMTLVEASPNPFLGIAPTEKVGFIVGAQLGDSVTDNSRRVDGYRYHDALHLAFVAVLGWSPIMRRLLKLKRRSSVATDRDQDGARAAYAEEGLTHILARMSEKRKSYESDKNIDGDTLSLIRLATSELESNDLPSWLWSRAIVKGFAAMRKLVENGGGYLIADLDQRELTHENNYFAKS